MLPSMTVSGPSLGQLARRGIELCREERWNEGLELLTQVFNASDGKSSSAEVPTSYLAYLGYGVARYKNKKRDGLALCEQAVKLEFYQADNWFNLARTAALVGERRKAISSLERALKLDPQHAASIAFRNEFGLRRPPVFGFLGRNHFLNRLFGKLRHDFTTPGVKAPKPAKTGR